MIALSPRLQTAADLLRGGARYVDVGTDHAYLPVYLIESGKCSDALACDIGEQPLENARRTVRQYSLENRIELRISDGLQNVRREEAEEISVCGMGGTLIVRILMQTAWLRDPAIGLVLQPMTHAEDVRAFLLTNGFSVVEERCVLEGERAYCCMRAIYTAAAPETDPGKWYFGSLSASDPAGAVYIEKQAARILKAARALEACGRRPWELKRLTAALAYYERNYV